MFSAMKPHSVGLRQVFPLSIQGEAPAPASYSVQQLQCLREFSHDMRTPLASILALCEQMVQAPAPSPALAERMLGHARQLMRMMDGFIAQTRVESDGIYKAERLVQDLIEESVDQVQDLAARRDVHLNVMQDASCHFVQVAGELMVRALNNVLVNAIKYGEPGSPISIGCRAVHRSQGLVVCIEVVNRIATLPAQGLPAMRSCGLGLDFVRRVAALHGGELELDLHGAGQARVVLTLPCTAEQM